MILAHDVTGTGPPVLLLGGLAFDRRCWDAVRPLLAEHYTVVRCELRGSGASPAPRRAYSNVRDLHDLVRFLGCGPVAVVGLSMGGRIAIEWAAAHPEDISAIVVVGASAPGVSPPRDVQECFLDVVALALGGDLPAARDRWMESPFLRASSPGVLADVRSMVDDYGGFHWRSRDPGTTVDAATFRLGDIRVPTLVVHGADEIGTLREEARKLAAGLPGASSMVVPGAGHLVPMDVPDEFAALVLDFLEDGGTFARVTDLVGA